MLTERAEAVGAKIEAREGAGVKVFSGIRTSEGIIVPSSRDESDAKKKSSEPVPVPAQDIAPGPANPQAAPAQVPAPTTVTVTFRWPAFGEIPGQYRHMYSGDRVVILGVIEQLSFIPQQETYGNPCRFELLDFPGKEFAYMGLNFIDANGTKNLILLEVSNG